MDESESYGSGVFDTFEEALAKCKQIVDEYLDSALEMDATMTSEQLYMSYIMFGESPFIEQGNRGFNASRYAEERAKEIVAQ